MMEKSVQQLMKEIQSDDQSTVEAARDALMDRGGEEVFQGMLDLLRSPDPWARHEAALVLADLGDDRAVEPLVTAFRNNDHTDNTGGFVFALLHLDCSRHFDFLTEIVLHRHYEVRMKALMILERQQFEVTGEEIAAARGAFERYAADRQVDPEVWWLVGKLNAVLDRLAADAVDAD